MRSRARRGRGRGGILGGMAVTARRANPDDAAELTRLLDWMRAAGIDVIDLHATPDGAPLYRSLGFTEPKAAPSAFASSRCGARRGAAAAGAAGAAHLAGVAGQPSRVGQRAAQQELDLGVRAAQLVVRPAGQCVVHRRIEPEQHALTFAHRDTAPAVTGTGSRC